MRLLWSPQGEPFHRNLSCWILAMNSTTNPPDIDAATIQQAHQLYSELTGQTVRLAFDRERAWWELLRAGFTLQDIRRVILYLQKEIREGRRNVGALKLSNLLQVDRFEEDFNLTRIQLKPRPTKPSVPGVPSVPSIPRMAPSEKQEGLAKSLAMLADLKRSI
jgi:hypothetical protein